MIIPSFVRQGMSRGDGGEPCSASQRERDALLSKVVRLQRENVRLEVKMKWWRRFYEKALQAQESNAMLERTLDLLAESVGAGAVERARMAAESMGVEDLIDEWVYRLGVDAREMSLLCTECFHAGPYSEEAKWGPSMALMDKSVPCEECGKPVTRDNFHWVREEEP